MDGKVIEVLQQASSQDPAVFKPAELTLKEWETQPGFYSTLFNVFSDRSFSLNVRWVAILYFKNGVTRYWRKNAPNAITAGEKEFLRQGLIAKFDEPINQLAIQKAVLIGDIARYDCPREWGSLVPTLLEVIQGKNPLAQHRALLTFYYVVKTLVSKRLPPDNTNFEELTRNLFNLIWHTWNTFTELFFVLVANGAEVHLLQEALEKAVLVSRILRQFIAFGFKNVSESEEAMLFLKVIFERTRTCLECRKNLLLRGIQLDFCDKFILKLTKILISTLTNHSVSFVELIPTALQFSVYFCFTDDGQSLSFERFTIQCLNLIRGIFVCHHYKRLQRARILRKDFFTEEVLKEIVTRLVTQYFLLTPSDLEEWDSTSENLDSCNNESWKYNLKHCSESVFTVISHHHKKITSMVVIDLMQRHHQLVDPNDLHGIILKDAVYNAVGLIASNLYDEVDFDQWFLTTLQQELKQQSYNYRIIRRRIWCLIGHWIRVKLGPELRPVLYKLVVESLRPEEDLMVRLAAGEALRKALDDFMFHTDDFIPFIAPVFSLLFTLLKEVNDFDTKMRVLNVLSFMIERIGSNIRPHVDDLNIYLPMLWQQSDDHNMLRCAIVSTLVHLEKALGSDSVLLQSYVVSVVALSCDMNQDSHIYFLEDGLELWLALLENSPAPTPAIMDLFVNMPTILDSSSENLRLCLYIIEAYVVLSPHEFLSTSGSVVVATISSILGDLQSEGIINVMRLLETCIRAAPQLGCQVIKPLLTRIFQNIYKEDNCSMVMTMYLSILARVLLDSRDVFVETIGALVRQLGYTDEETVLGEIVRVWVKRMALVFQPEQRKLLALALCSLLGINSPPSVLVHFHLIITNIVETLNDVSKLNYETGFYTDSLMINEQISTEDLDIENDDYETEHMQRKNKLAYSDPVHCVSLKEVFQDQLNIFQNLVGANQFEAMMSTINSEIEQQMKEYVNIRG